MRASYRIPNIDSKIAKLNKKALLESYPDLFQTAGGNAEQHIAR